MKTKRVYFLLIFCVLVLGIAGIPNTQCYPPTSTYHFEPTTIQATIFIFLIGTETVTINGSITVQTSDPYDPGDGRIKIDTEIISSNFVGTSALIGPVTITGSPTKISSGAIQQQVAGNDFPADSWFNAFFEMHTTLPYPHSTIHNNEPISIGAEIDNIPPYGTTYMSTTGIITLSDEEGSGVGYIGHPLIFTLPPSPPVGGEAASINKVIIEPELQIPWIWLSTIILSLVLTVVYVKKRKRHTEINS